MPIYEYRCLGCETKFQKLVTGSATSIQCPECGETNVKKCFSAFGFKCTTPSGKSVFVPSTGGNGCSSCGSHNCSTCGH